MQPHDHALVRLFLAEGMPGVKPLLLGAYAEARSDPRVAVRSFQIGRFDLTIDFEVATVKIEDVLNPEASGEVTLRLGDFENVLQTFDKNA